MKPFLDCNIWSVFESRIKSYYLVEKIYQFNSMESGYNPEYSVGNTQIPEFEIGNLEALDNLDYAFINNHKIPVLKNNDESWSIDLTHYEQQYLILQP